MKEIQQYYVLWQEANRMYEDWAITHGLTYSELLVVLSLAQQVDTQKQICEQWQLSKQTVHTVMKDFIKRGWIELVVSATDKRNKHIKLLAEGKQPVMQIAAALEAIEQQAWNQLGSKRAKELLAHSAMYNQVFKELMHEDV